MHFNDEIVTEFSLILRTRLPEFTMGRELSSDFEDLGETQINKSFVLRSLTLTLSKIWLCVPRMRADGGIDTLPPGVGEPKIMVDDTAWAGIYRDEADAWLDVKGAYIDDNGLAYQLKNPFSRARDLRSKGLT
jgi:hypothetical protein